MTEKIPTIENISSDFEIAQKDLRSAFANVTPKSWLYQYTENLEKMVHNGEFEKARNLLKKKQEMPDTLDYTKTEIQNILNAIDLYEPESIKQKTEHKEPLKIDMTGKDGTPEIKEDSNAYAGSWATANKYKMDDSIHALINELDKRYKQLD